MMQSTFDHISNNLWKCLDNKESIEIIINIFSEEHTNKEKFALALHNLQVLNLLPFSNETESVRIKNKKSEDQSIVLRNAGNKMFAKTDPNLREALQLYTKSVACAPYPNDPNSNSQHLAIAFANRSAAFFAMKKYRLCLTDIERAENLNYPDHLKPKLQDRKEKCLLHLGMSNEKVTTSQDDELLKSTILKLENIKIYTETAVADSFSTNEILPVLREIPKISFGQHKKISPFSNCIKVARSESGLRFIRATKDINPGDILVVEKPYSSILLPDNYSTHCFKCLQRCEALIPCKHCPMVMFCSEICREASQPYHLYECAILSSLLNLDMGHDWLLALRVTLVGLSKHSTLDDYQKTIKALELHHSIKDLTGIEAMERFQCSDPQYGVIHYLCQNTEYRTFKNVYKLATIAACIVNCLDVHTDIFAKCNDVKEAQQFVGGLLLQNLQSLPCNNYTVVDLVQSTTGEKHLSTESFGCAVYPFSSFFNHSCDPHVFRSFCNGDEMAVVAQRPIRQGEQVFADYGYTHNQFQIIERQNLIKANYFFECHCEACEEHWSDSSILEIEDPFFLCFHCKTPLVFADIDFTMQRLEVCKVCKKKNNIGKLNEDLEKMAKEVCAIKTRLLEGCDHNFSRQLADLLTALNNLVERPNQVIIVAQDALRHSLMSTGNLYHI